MSADPSIDRAFMLSADDETLSATPKQLLNLFRDLDVLIQIFSSTNTQELADVAPHKLQLWARANAPLLPLIESNRWNVTLHPTESLAQEAKMSLEAYSDFVFCHSPRLA